MCVVLCADHGPCVSGAHNTIVTARAGKDIISCLVSGLLTIGPRFGGAIDDAARCFQAAVAEVGGGVVCGAGWGRLWRAWWGCVYLCVRGGKQHRRVLGAGEGRPASVDLWCSERVIDAVGACLPPPQPTTLQGQEPDEFVEGMKKRGIRVPGIGHR